jgi:hypothetical protein
VAVTPDAPVGEVAEPVAVTPDAPVGEVAEPVAVTPEVTPPQETFVDDFGGEAPQKTFVDDFGGEAPQKTFVDSGEVLGDEGAAVGPVDTPPDASVGAGGDPPQGATGSQSTPGQPQLPGQTTPGLPDRPGLPGQPSMPGLPRQPGLPGDPAMPGLPTGGLPDLPADGTLELPTEGVPKLPSGVELPADPASVTSGGGGWQPIHALPLAAAGATAAGKAIKGRIGEGQVDTGPISDEAGQRAIEATHAERSGGRSRGELSDEQFLGQPTDWQFTIGHHTLHLQPSTGRWHVLADGHWVDTGHDAGTVTFGVIDGGLVAKPTRG